MIYWSEIFDEEKMKDDAKRIKELPGTIKKESEKLTKKWSKPAYETGANSNRRTLEMCLEELSKKWTTDNGMVITEEMTRLNEDINSTLHSMKSSLLNISKVGMNVNYTKSDEEVDL